MKNSSYKILIGVIGDGNPTSPYKKLAFRVGQKIAEFGAVLVCGGLYGVMEAACEGAKSAGGITIGILPGSAHSDANSFVDIPIPTGMDQGRNILVVRASHGIVAIGGGAGTLSELGLALKLGVPVVGLETWQLPGTEGRIFPADDGEEAVETIYAVISKGTGASQS